MCFKKKSVLFGIAYILMVSGSVFMVPDIFVRRFYTFQAFWVVGGVVLFSFMILLLKQSAYLNRNTVLLLLLSFFLLSVYSVDSLHGLTGMVLFCCFCSFAFNGMETDGWRQWVYQGFIWVTLVQSLWGIGQFLHFISQIDGGLLTGSFDNPAGLAACIVLTFPFSLYTLRDTGGLKKWIALFAILLSSVVLLLSRSRAGILSLVVILGLWAYYETSLFSSFRLQAKRKKRIACFIALLVVMSVLYFLKVNSANGRLLIWQISLSMVVNKPWTGYGYGGFLAHYMPTQGRFFSRNPEHVFAILADNTSHAFNEYIEIVVNYGILGLLIVLGYISFLLNSYCKRPAAYKCPAVYGLIALAVFSMFSYPFEYPFIWLMTGVFTCILTGDDNKQIKIPRFLNVPLASILFIVVGPLLKQKWVDERKWYHIAQLSMSGHTNEMIGEYEQLYERMRTEGLFLYNYAAELSLIHKYEYSNRILMECMDYFNDADVQLLLAYNSAELNNFIQAENFYKRAAAMCPCRFVPLYRLFQMYCDNGDTINAIGMAHQIVNKKVKISSPLITRIRFEAKEYLRLVSQP